MMPPPLDDLAAALTRQRRALVADLVAVKRARDRDARRDGAKLRMRGKCRVYFARLLAQHARDGAVRTVAPLPLRR